MPRPSRRNSALPRCAARELKTSGRFKEKNLRIPGFEQPWEVPHGKPGRIVSALDVMTEGPLGASAYNNEFGRPAIAGYLGVKRDTVYKWIDRKKMPAHKVGSLWKFRKDEIDEWVRTGESSGAKKPR